MTQIETDNPFILWRIAYYDWLWDNRAFVCAVFIIYIFWLYAKFKNLNDEP